MPGFITALVPDISYFPVLIFLSLLLSGINFPFSEDILIISAALAAEANPDYLLPLFASVYSEVLISDHIAYWAGYKLGSRIQNSRCYSICNTFYYFLYNSIQTVHGMAV